MEPVPVHIGGQAVKQLVALIIGLKLLLGLLLGHEFRPGHVGHRLDVVLEGFGLLLGEALVDVRRELVLGLQIAEHVLRIHRHQGKGAHDEQAADNHANRGEGHKAVSEDAVEALGEEIAEIISLSHCCNTRPSRR